MQSESSTNDIQKSPEWEKVEKPAPALLRPQDGWGDSSATYGPFPPTSPGYSGASEKEVEHASMSWTACYDDGCFVHLSEKQGRWYPQEQKKNTLSRKTYPTPHNHHLLLLLLLNRRSQNMATQEKCMPRGYLGISATERGVRPIRKKRGGTEP